MVMVLQCVPLPVFMTSTAISNYGGIPGNYINDTRVTPTQLLPYLFQAYRDRAEPTDRVYDLVLLAAARIEPENAVADLSPTETAAPGTSGQQYRPGRHIE